MLYNRCRSSRVEWVYLEFIKQVCEKKFECERQTFTKEISEAWDGAV